MEKRDPATGATRLKTSKKRIFIGLLGLTFALIMGFILIGGWVATIGLENLYPGLTLIAQAIAAIAFLFLSGIIFTLVFAVIFEKELPFSQRVRGLGIKLFLPLMEIIGPRLLKISKESIRNSFIEINNRLLLSSHRHKIAPDHLLLLLPHCLQQADCQRRVTTSIDNCLECGKCNIDPLKKLARAYGVRIAVATGGTLARKIVRDHRPQIIVAVACERDLTSGIHDTFPLPVYGILNQRPEGPCWNTRVEVEEVENALRTFLRTTGNLKESPSSRQ
ncbi:MAG: DUF116 domain-containing protein [Deltaproteobacteria bacterium]|nr:DUF116 domain-containing protein [Deltaproteobacteria bacterium]